MSAAERVHVVRGRFHFVWDAGPVVDVLVDGEHVPCVWVDEIRVGDFVAGLRGEPCPAVVHEAITRYDAGPPQGRRCST